MSTLEMEKRQIRRLLEDLRGSRYQLIGIQASIPPTRQETSPEDLESDPDAPTAVRSLLANAVRDRLDPLIRDLDAAAGYEPPQEEDS
jgi:hypothetical protein